MVSWTLVNKYVNNLVVVVVVYFFIRMNWIFSSSKGSGAVPPLTSLQKQRQRQIESLKAAHSTYVF